MFLLLTLKLSRLSTIFTLMQQLLLRYLPRRALVYINYHSNVFFVEIRVFYKFVLPILTESGFWMRDTEDFELNYLWNWSLNLILEERFIVIYLWNYLSSSSCDSASHVWNIGARHIWDFGPSHNLKSNVCCDFLIPLESGFQRTIQASGQSCP